MTAVITNDSFRFRPHTQNQLLVDLCIMYKVLLWISRLIPADLSVLSSRAWRGEKRAGVTHSVIYHLQGDKSENSLEFFNPDQIIDTTPVFVLRPGSSCADWQDYLSRQFSGQWTVLSPELLVANSNSSNYSSESVSDTLWHHFHFVHGWI